MLWEKLNIESLLTLLMEDSNERLRYGYVCYFG